MSMLRELENLLRDISEQRAAQGTQPARPDDMEPVEAEIVEGETVHHWQRDAADQPIHQLGAEDIVPHASHLGRDRARDGGLADEELDAHTHSKFDHDLTQLDDVYADKSEGGESPPEPRPAIDVAAMLGNPHSLRDAIILSEILRRPHDRW